MEYSYTDRRDRLASIGVLALGVIVAIVAVIALNNPGHSAGDDGKPVAAQSPQNRTSLGFHDSSSSSSVAPPPAQSSSSSASAPASSSSPPSSAPASSSSASSSSSAAPPGSLPDPKTFQIVIMNNTTTTGLAAGAETRLESGGWTISHIGTMKNDIVSTCVYYDPAVPGAQQAAEALQAQYPDDIKRTAPRFAELYDGSVVLVLTWDYKPAA